jgi:hypothetical protein
MRLRPAAAAGTLVVTGLLALAPAAPALAACDAYSGGCVTQPPSVLPTTQTSVAPTTAVRGSTGGSPAALPFTGGELVLVSVTGAAAVAGGAALVVAGRRRKA